MERARIYLTGVGGQGTLTATTLFSRAALDAGLDITSGEIHGMAQRGGVVESTVMLGGWLSPRIEPGEADIMLGFEPLEALRGLKHLKRGGTAVVSTDIIPPIGVSLGGDAYPDLSVVTEAVDACASRVVYLPAKQLGEKAGAAQSGNLALMAALLALDALPLTVEHLRNAVKTYLKPKLVDVNLQAIDLGVRAAIEGDGA